MKIHKIVDSIVVCFLQQTMHYHINQRHKVFILPDLENTIEKCINKLAIDRLENTSDR